MKQTKLAIKTSHGFELIQVDDILCCYAHGRYTRIVTTNGKSFLLSRILKDIEDCLSDEPFFRTHKSCLINLNHVKNYRRNHETPITLMNDVKVQLARRRKHAFNKCFDEIAQAL